MLYSDYITTGIYWGFMIAYGITIISVIVVILSENRNPVKSLAWVTVLLLFPAVGLILYVFFGRSFKNKRMISRRNKRKLKKTGVYHGCNADMATLSADSRQQIRLAQSLSGSVYYPGNQVQLFTEGIRKFECLKADLLKATDYIHLQYYIFEDDHIGHEIRQILIDKANQGVKVRVIYDHIGSLKAKKRFFREMRDAGIMVYPFFKVSFPPFGARINWRNHRKIVVIDGKVGYVGGMNIADRYLDGGKKFAMWRDTHMRVTGPAVSALQYSFAVDWNFMKQPLLIDDTINTAPEGSSVGLQVITSGPVSQWNNIAHLFLKAISTARKRVFIQTPYFLPTESMLKALQSAALSRVDVRIMMPRFTDSALLRYASASYIHECLQAGIKFYYFNAGMLHSKNIIIDDEFSSVGSANFDFRSFEHNFECNMLIYSRDVNKQMTEIFMHDLRDCTRINAVEWSKRSIIDKSLESLVRLLSPIL